MIHGCQLFLSSTFSQFQHIYEDYVPKADEEISQILTTDGFIDPDVSLPIEYIIDNIPILKEFIGTFNVMWNQISPECTKHRKILGQTVHVLYFSLSSGYL